MKRIFWLLFFHCITLILTGQRAYDYGVLAGTTSYFGDINTTRLFYAPSPAAGVFYRYNLHPRQALRTSFILGGVRGKDNDFNSDFQKNREASFSGSVSEFALQFEFNFLPFSTQGLELDYTTYLAGGAGIAFINSSSVKKSINNVDFVKTDTYTYVPVIPFSIGFKVNIYKNLGLEAEYGFRKTFYDNFDGLKDLVAPSDVSWLNNNDWYSFVGIAVSWKVYSKLRGCPAYGEMDSKRKR
jgi:hypothetical protein